MSLKKPSRAKHPDEAGPCVPLCMTKCVKLLRAKAKAESMDQSQARIEPFVTL